jgi:hypothetical protein
MFLRTLEITPKLTEKLKAMAVDYNRIDEIIMALGWYLKKDAHKGTAVSSGDRKIWVYKRELKHLDVDTIVAYYTLEDNHIIWHNVKIR